ncbi:unnamed protein product, partial [Staurois parvus]
MGTGGAALIATGEAALMGTVGEKEAVGCIQGRTDNSWGPRAIGDHGPLCPCPNSKKPMKKVPGAYHGAPTDPGPSGSPRVSKWSVRPWLH